MPDVTWAHNRHKYEDRFRRALVRLGEWIEETVSRTTEPGEVVTFPKEARA